ncbi:hypothetical protein V8E53_001596 [Lactarius tabidus]
MKIRTDRVVSLHDTQTAALNILRQYVLRILFVPPALAPDSALDNTAEPTGLFSAAVASLISVSIQDLQQNPQDTSNFYLANIYQATTNPNPPNISSSLPSSPPPFTPPNHAVWVNALWFMSLVISLTCALLATFLQQWARRYLKVTHSRYSPHKRARIRAFFAEGVEKCFLPWVVETLPTLLHISLFLFFAGLVVFLWNVNLTIFKLVLSWVAFCTALYGCFTLMPIFRYDSPYYTSLSSSAWPIVYCLAFFVSTVGGVSLYLTCWRRGGDWFLALARRYYGSLSRGMQKTAEKTALKSPSELDTRAFMWTFDCLDEDHELERFFYGLPGFCNSKLVKDPLPILSSTQQRKINDSLTGFMDRTFSSDLLSPPVKERRAMICARAIDTVHIPLTFNILDRILSKCQYTGPLVARSVQIMRRWEHNSDVARAAIYSILLQAQRRDDPWFILASDTLGSPEASLRDYAAHGDSLSLVVLIHVVRQQFNLLYEQDWPRDDFWKVLEVASKFDVLDTSPELQHEFCALWNQVTRGTNSESYYILRPICNIYFALHPHTNSAPTAFSPSTGDNDRILWNPTTYPLCNVPGHHSHSTPHTPDVAIPTVISHAVLPGDVELVPSSLASTPDAPSPSVPTTVNVGNNPMDVPLLDNMSIHASSYRAHQTATESVRDSATSLDPVAVIGAGNSPSTRTMPSTPHETSTSTSSVTPPAEVSLQNNADHLVHSDPADVPSSASPALALGDITATISPGTSPLPSFAPDLDTAEGSTRAVSREDRGDLHSPSVNRVIQANTVAILDPSPQPPTLPSATDITITSPSQQGLDAEHTGDRPHSASH